MPTNVPRISPFELMFGRKSKLDLLQIDSLFQQATIDSANKTADSYILDLK